MKPSQSSLQIELVIMAYHRQAILGSACVSFAGYKWLQATFLCLSHFSIQVLNQFCLFMYGHYNTHLILSGFIIMYMLYICNNSLINRFILQHPSEKRHLLNTVCLHQNKYHYSFLTVKYQESITSVRIAHHRALIFHS